MSKYLVIVESPAKAKTIKKYLGKDYNVVASMGHVRDLPKSRLGVDIENNFEPSYVKMRDKSALLKEIKQKSDKSDIVYLATDPDREGEAISWHLAQALKIPQEKQKRVVFNEITKDAVKNAVANPRDIDYDLVDAQQARRVLDRIVGYKISPLLWRNVKRGLSAGRVQSVALKLICDKERLILAFKPEEYWTLSATLTKQGAKKQFKALFHGDLKKKINLKNEKQATEIFDAVENAPYSVRGIKKTKRKKYPSPPFITSTLQQEAARKLGFTASRTMICAQQLYEGINIKGQGEIGLITYMRTDSTRIATEAALAAKDYILQGWGKEYLPKSMREYKNKKNAQDAHEAIRPSVVKFSPSAIKDSLSADQFKIYKLIWERFMASQMEAADVESVHVDVQAAGYIFKSKGETILFPGYTVLYTEGSDQEINEDENNQTLPPMEEGEVLNKLNLDKTQHFTKPPARYTEATLIKVLEEKGIGRPSTYAPTISTILARNYVEKDKRALLPTELGMIVDQIMEQHFDNIVNIDFTANMENRLDSVEEGDAAWTQVLREFYDPFEKTLEKATTEIQRVVVEPEKTDVICENCGKNMVIKEGRFGKFLACPGYPDCKNTKPIVKETGVDCPKCGGRILEKKSQKNARYYGCEKNPTCDFMSWNLPTDEKCPDCGKMLLKRSLRGRILPNSKVCIDEGCTYNQKKPEKEKKTDKAKKTAR